MATATWRTQSSQTPFATNNQAQEGDKLTLKLWGLMAPDHVHLLASRKLSEISSTLVGTHCVYYTYSEKEKGQSEALYYSSQTNSILGRRNGRTVLVVQQRSPNDKTRFGKGTDRFDFRAKRNLSYDRLKRRLRRCEAHWHHVPRSARRSYCAVEHLSHHIPEKANLRITISKLVGSLKNLAANTPIFCYLPVRVKALQTANVLRCVQRAVRTSRLEQNVQLGVQKPAMSLRVQMPPPVERREKRSRGKRSSRSCATRWPAR